MTATLPWYRLTLNAKGTVLSCEAIDAPDVVVRAGGKVLELQAKDEDEAKHKAYNFYCARKKREQTAKKHAAGICVCGRKQDRKNPLTGRFFLTCSVCAERRIIQHTSRIANGGKPLPPRDEVARVVALKERVRDRKNEIRLEVLIEVRKQWENCRTVGKFSAWLTNEINESLKPRTAEQNGKQEHG